MLWLRYERPITSGRWVDALPSEPIRTARRRSLVKGLIRQLRVRLTGVRPDVQYGYDLLGGRETLSLSLREFAYEAEGNIRANQRRLMDYLRYKIRWARKWGKMTELTEAVSRMHGPAVNLLDANKQEDGT